MKALSADTVQVYSFLAN